MQQLCGSGKAELRYEHIGPDTRSWDVYVSADSTGSPRLVTQQAAASPGARRRSAGGCGSDMDAERERQIAQAAEQLAHAVYSFLSSCTAAATSLNQALVAAQAGHGPLPVHLPPIPLPRPPAAAVTPAPFFATPAREASRSLSLTFPALEASPAWSPLQLFQQQLAAAAAVGASAGLGGSTAATRSSGGQAGGARRGAGQHSPPKQPPPLFNAQAAAAAAANGLGALARGGSEAAAAAAAVAAGDHGLFHWKSEVSANMAALAGSAGGALPASPINSPRAAALMAVCQEAEQTDAQPLAHMGSNQSSGHGSGGGSGEQQPAAGGTGGAALAKQRSDLESLAQMAEEEYEAAAAAAATTAAVVAAAEAAATTGNASTLPAPAPLEGGAAGKHAREASAEPEAAGPASKRQRPGSGNASSSPTPTTEQQEEHEGTDVAGPPTGQLAAAAAVPAGGQAVDGTARA
ncbi:hypothetical protein ABPG77_001706 [Micractinium sp. CCAP 211/92]